MAVRKIIKVCDPILKKKCREVTSFDSRLHTLLDDLNDTLKISDGLGLAAPQVGVLRRVFIIRLDGVVYEIVNPSIITTEGQQNSVESCLSVPNLYGLVIRPTRILVSYYDRNGSKLDIEGTSLLARILCHELDHLQGKLYTESAIKFLKEPE